MLKTGIKNGWGADGTRPTAAMYQFEKNHCTGAKLKAGAALGFRITEVGRHFGRVNFCAEKNGVTPFSQDLSGNDTKKFVHDGQTSRGTSLELTRRGDSYQLVVLIEEKRLETTIPASKLSAFFD